MASSVRNILRVYVKNLPWTVSHSELRQYFNKFGPISSALVVFDKKTGLSRKYGFVTCSTLDTYNAVLNQQHKLEGQDIYVQPVLESPQVGNN